MLGNQYGINLGQIYNEAYALKNAKLKNQLLQQQVDNNKPVSRSVFINQGKQKLLDISHKLTMQRLKQNNPDLSDEQIQQMANQETQRFNKNLDKFYNAPTYTQKQYANAVNQYGQQLYYLTTLPPEQQNEAYQKWKSQLPASEQKNVPENYDPDWVKLEMMRSAGALKLYEDDRKYFNQSKLSNQKYQNSLALEKTKNSLYNQSNVKKIKLFEQLNDYKTNNAMKLNKAKAQYNKKSTSLRDTGYKENVRLHQSTSIDKILDNLALDSKTKLKVASQAEKYMSQGMGLNTALKKALNEIQKCPDGMKLKKDGKLFICQGGKLYPYTGD